MHENTFHNVMKKFLFPRTFIANITTIYICEYHVGENEIKITRKKKKKRIVTSDRTENDMIR